MLQKKSIGLTISHTATLLNNSMNKKIKPYGIAIEQRAILEIIDSKIEIKQSKLCDILQKDKTTISRTLKTLESKKYINRVKIDNKTHLVNLTNLGKKVLEDTKDIVIEFRENIIDALKEEEISNLYSYIDKINTVIKNTN